MGKNEYNRTPAMREYSGRRMRKELGESNSWDKAFLRTKSFYLSKSLAGYREWELLRFVKQWVDPVPGIALKTDAFEEAFGQMAVVDWLVKKSRKVIITDISSQILNGAKTKNGDYKVTWAVSDIRRMPFKDNSVDLIFSTNTYGYLDKVAQGLQEARRILKDQGKLIISVRNKDNITNQAALSFRKNAFPAASAFKRNDFERLLRDCGFIAQGYDYIVHIPALLNPTMLILDKKDSLIFKFARSVIIRQLELFSEKSRFLKFLTGWFIIYSAKKT